MIETAIDELRKAIEFLDNVNSAPTDTRIAVGADPWEWLESAARRVVVEANQQEPER